MNETTYYEPSSREQANNINNNNIEGQLQTENRRRYKTALVLCSRMIDWSGIRKFPLYFEQIFRWKNAILRTRAIKGFQLLSFTFPKRQFIAFFYGCIYSLWIWQKKIVISQEGMKISFMPTLSVSEKERLLHLMWLLNFWMNE